MIVVGTNSWISIDDADTYFDSRLYSEEWRNAVAITKQKALITAFKQINAQDNLGFPTTATQKMKDAQCEQVLYLLKFGEGAERRAALQSQGVTSAGIVKESYQEGKVLCKEADKLLESYKTDTDALYSGLMERDESI